MCNKIILNVPHASIEGVFNQKNGWRRNLPVLQRKVFRWTDWFTDYLFSSNNPGVVMKRCPFSRFVVDAERLVNDPLEERGQGIVYTEYEGVVRDIEERRKRELTDYHHRYQKELGGLISSDDDILIDCHSFPSDLALDVDVCIGFNEDWSKPSNEFMDDIRSFFEQHGLRAAFNHPFSNSITPQSRYKYKSFMLEINKKCYMNESDITLDSQGKMHEVIGDLYQHILSGQTSAKG
jgi:N-formylglutamate amidohydrolase